MIQISRLFSIIHRQGTRYFDRELLKTGVGFGQQFFLICICETPGITMQKLSQLGYFDKGTVTKAVKKLEVQGYLIRKPDDLDKRLSHLYLTESALPLLEEVYRIRKQWNDILLNGLTDIEREQAEALLIKIAENACSSIKTGG